MISLAPSPFSGPRFSIKEKMRAPGDLGIGGDGARLRSVDLETRRHGETLPAGARALRSKAQ
jgi:hypothetical protein